MIECTVEAEGMTERFRICKLCYREVFIDYLDLFLRGWLRIFFWLFVAVFLGMSFIWSIAVRYTYLLAFVDFVLAHCPVFLLPLLELVVDVASSYCIA